MRKIQIVGLALVAVFAFSAFTASAFAVSKLLLNGAEITAATSIQVSGELLLQDTGAPATPDLICSAIYDGTIAVGGTLITVEGVLTLAGVLLEVTGGDLLECASETCTNPVDEELLNFPWNVDIELSGAAYLAVFLTEKTPEYNIDCNTILGLVQDNCSGLTSARLFIGAGTAGLLGSFNSLAITEPFGAASQNTNCSVGGAGKGIMESPGDTEANAGSVTSTSGPLTLSE
jgi:hypothetical protein